MRGRWNPERKAHRCAGVVHSDWNICRSVGVVGQGQCRHLYIIYNIHGLLGAICVCTYMEIYT